MTARPSSQPAVDINEWQRRTNIEATRRWPDLSVATEGLALFEEGGEVARAILKRGEGTRGTSSEWTAQLRLELGQTMFVLLNIIALEGWTASEVLQGAWDKFLAKPDKETMDGQPVAPDSAGHGVCDHCGKLATADFLDCPITEPWGTCVICPECHTVAQIYVGNQKKATEQ